MQTLASGLAERINDRRDINLGIKQYGPEFLRAYNYHRPYASHHVAFTAACHHCGSQPHERARRERESYRYARRNGLKCRKPQTVPGVRRPEGNARARRPRTQATRSSAASGDSGSDSDSDEPARGGLPIVVVAATTMAGDAAVARTFERILVARRPGTNWSATP